MNSLSYKQKKVIEVFGLNIKMKSPKGWILGGSCPICGQSDKFGIKMNPLGGKYKNHVSWNCFRGSCKSKGSEYSLLKAVGKLHLIQDGEFIGDKNRVELPKEDEEDEVIDISTPKRHKPLGWKRFDDDEYLRSRGFVDWQFNQYSIGKTTLIKKLREYVVFLILEEGENKGYIARSTKSSEWISERNAKIKEYNRNREEGEQKYPPYSKYKNEGGVDFGKLIFGIDEITPNTHTVILVEGVTDKCNVDKQLNLHRSEEVKCGCTFGKKISMEQIAKLHMRGVKNITLMYDPDALEESKRYSTILEMWFDQVKVGYLREHDPGDMNENELLTIIEAAQSPQEFCNSKVLKKVLR